MLHVYCKSYCDTQLGDFLCIVDNVDDYGYDTVFSKLNTLGT